MKKILLTGVMAVVLFVAASVNCTAGEVLGWWTYQDAANPGKDSSANKFNLKVIGDLAPANGEVTLSGTKATRMYLKPKLAEDFKLGKKSFAVEVWFKSAKLSKYNRIVGSRGTIRPMLKDEQVGWALGFTRLAANFIFIVNDSEGNMSLTQIPVVKADWDGKKLNYLVGVRDLEKKELRLYLNGKLVATKVDKSGDIAGKNARLEIGYDAYTGSATNGTYAEVKVSTGALTDAEVAKKFAAGPTK